MRARRAFLDLGLTLEYLETQGVPVLGLRTDELPAFYCRTSGFKLDYNCPDEATVAKIMKTKWDIGLKGGAIVGNPVPEQYAMDPVEMNKVIDRAVEMAKEQGIHGKATTPFPAGAHCRDDRRPFAGHEHPTRVQQRARRLEDRQGVCRAVIEIDTSRPGAFEKRRGGRLDPDAPCEGRPIPSQWKGPPW